MSRNTAVDFAVASFLWIDTTIVMRLDVSFSIVVFLWRYVSPVSRLDVRYKAGVSNALVARRHGNGELHILKRI